MKFPAVDVDKEPLLRKNSAVKLYAPVDDSVEDGLRLDIDDAHPNNSTYLSPSFNGPKGYKSEGGSPSAMRQYVSSVLFCIKRNFLSYFLGFIVDCYYLYDP